MMFNTIILIPPSEGKKAGGQFPPTRRVSKNTLAIIKKIKNVKQTQWPKILGVKGKALLQAIESNQKILDSPLMPAINRYSGVVYNAIDYLTLDDESKNFFDQHVRIVSAVYGLLKPKDLIADYKLKINQLGVDRYWREISRDFLKDKFVIDLLPQAHQKAVQYSTGSAVSFYFEKNGKKVLAGHLGKQMKGKFIRWLCENKVSDMKCLQNFTEDGIEWKDSAFVKKLD